MNTLVYSTLVYIRRRYNLVLPFMEQRLGQVIKRRREAIGLSQEEFAERAEVHRTYVSQLERGLKSPSVRIIVRVAQALGCRPWELLREAEVPARGRNVP